MPINTVVCGNNVNNVNDGNDSVYIGTDIGVFYRDNTLGDWIPYSNGLVVEVTDVDYSGRDNTLYAGTYGRGIGASSVYSSCPTDRTITAANQAIEMLYYG